MRQHWGNSHHTYPYWLCVYSFARDENVESHRIEIRMPTIITLIKYMLFSISLLAIKTKQFSCEVSLSKKIFKINPAYLRQR